MPQNMPQKMTNHGSRQSGFTIIEVIVATIVLMIGIVGVAKLVPFAIGLNAANRRDSTSLVIAQREMDALISQPLSVNTFTDPQGLVCPAAGVCNLGIAVSTPALAGSPVVMIANRPFINYSAGTVAGYNFIYTDPNDPSSASYDVRWAVITYATPAGVTTGRRFIVGVRRQTGNGPLLPVALDSMVEK